MGRRQRRTGRAASVPDATLASDPQACPLCEYPAAAWHCRDRLRAYFACPVCGLIFADAMSRPTPAVEKSLYDLHQNDPADPAYLGFLRQLTEPLQQRLLPGQQGLDYGCGPGPALSEVLARAGWAVANYDPLYASQPVLLARQYDFVTCTEVVEHFHRARSEWHRLLGLVRPGGWLGVMTCLVPDPAPEAFRRWWYKGDLTHVSFYQAQTFDWICRQWQWRVDYRTDRVIILHNCQA